MTKRRPIHLFLAQCALSLVAVVFSIQGNAQAPARTPYSAPGNWTVTTYRAGDSGAFLRCSAERHYGGGFALTIARNAAGKFVLGFTSDDWTYEDRSTHPVSVRIDSGEETLLPGRVRLLPSGPIVFVDIETDSSVITEISAGNILHVHSAETALEFELAGSAAAVESTNRCYQDASD